ncbi:MAG: hypothetical protein AAF999_10375 [Pseudomonadota bacterium]
MVPLRLERCVDPGPAQSLSPEAVNFINHLRFISMGCRSKRSTSLFEACALLHVEKSASREAYADALMRCLDEALGKRTRLFAPGTTELSFDESWLVRLGLASAMKDEGSVDFLLRSRVGREHRRLVRYLVAQISKCFSLI